MPRWIVALLSLGVLVGLVACGAADNEGSRPSGQQAAQATNDALETAIARQTAQTPEPSATALIINRGPLPTDTLAPLAEAAIATAAQPSPSLTPTVTPTPLPSATATLPATDTATATDAPAPSETPASSPTPAEAGLNDLQGDHFWLARPFQASDNIKDYGEATYRFGSTAGGRYQLHHGIDISNPQGTVVQAVAGGEVFFAGDDFNQQIFGPRPNFYGNHVVLAHRVTLPDTDQRLTIYTLYGHLSRVYVEAGQRVEQYDPLGEVGATGVALGPHLHLEVRMGNPYDYESVYNPDLWLQPWNGYGVLAGRLSNSNGELITATEVQVTTLEGGRVYRTFTYTSDAVQSDPFYQENFVLPDLPTGEYQVTVGYQGRVVFRQQVSIQSQATTFITIQVE